MTKERASTQTVPVSSDSALPHVAQHQRNILGVELFRNRQRQKNIAYLLHTESHSSTHIFFGLNWPKCAVCDRGNETRAQTGECLVAMGNFSGRQPGGVYTRRAGR